jgi:hypothetical protein
MVVRSRAGRILFLNILFHRMSDIEIFDISYGCGNAWM